MAGVLPNDFVVVRGGASGDLDVVHFSAGEPTASPRRGARVVLHLGLGAQALQPWRTSGALCLEAERALALVAPGRVTAATLASARACGELWARAGAELQPNSEVLRRAAALLPESDAGLRSLLQGAVAQLATPAGFAAILEETSPRVGAGAVAPPFTDWHLPPHEVVDAVFAHLCRVAPAARLFEPRTGQIEMAHAALDALTDSHDLIVEAGTGIGKTLAYAIPAVVLAVGRGDRIVVSTHTRNLQHQLVDRDLPWLWRALDLDGIARPDGGVGLRYAKLLGRENYACRTALARAVRSAGEARFDLAQALLWSLSSSAGELSDLASVLDERTRRDLESRQDVCGGKPCRAGEPCPVFVAREAARRADLVVVNHALLFSDALADGGLLGRTTGVVLDEAHHLDAVATEHLSVRIGRARSESLVAPLARLAALDPAEASPRLRAAGRDVAAARAHILSLLEALSRTLPTTRSAARTRQRYRDADELFAGVRDEVVQAAQALDLARQAIESLADDATIAANGDGASGVLDLLNVLLAESRAALDFLTAAADEDWSFALDLDGRTVHEIIAMPLDVAPSVRRLLSRGVGTVYTSATLATGHDLEHFARRVGLPAATRQRILPSPFDWEAQCRVVIAQHLPAYDDPTSVPRAAALLAAVARRTPRRMLVLCTAHRTVRQLHAALLGLLGPRAAVWGQDVSGSRERLASRFATTPGAILIGTASFWEGVDFPGDALEILAIFKLPFRPPDDPLVEARCERLKARGDDPFGDYLLPDAVLRFRQGFGRLVRTQSDRGVVLVLDPRLGDRNYGGAFRRALPVVPLPLHDDATVVDHVGEWFESPAPMPLVDGDNRADARCLP